MSETGIDAAVAELNEIVRLDGAELLIVEASPQSIRLALDLSRSSCPECVVPKELMLGILSSKLADVDPDIHIELNDPRENPDYVAAGH